MKVRVQTLFLALIAACLLNASCAAWYDHFRKDPVAQVQSTISTLQTVINIATLVFGDVYPMLPAAKQAEIKNRYDHAILAIENSKNALRHGLAVAEAAKNGSPDIGTLLTNAAKAANDLRMLVREMQSLITDSATKTRLAAGADDLDFACKAIETRAP